MNSRAGHGTPVGISWCRGKKRDRINSFDLLAKFYWCSPGHSWHSGLQMQWSNDLSSGTSQSWIFSRAIPKPFVPQSRNCHSSGARHCIWPCWTSCVSHGPASQAVKVHLDVTNSLKLISCTAQLGVICRLAEVAVSPITCVIDEDVE